MTERARSLAVLGSPIAHSLSPALHGAAYRTLGLPWSYGSHEVTGGGLAAFVAACGGVWRGLSLTMPLKRDVMPLLDTVDAVARLTGVANTLLFDDEGSRRGFNTDVAGLVRAFRNHDVTRLTEAVILGGGATAGSAMVAAHQLGAARVVVVLRDPAKGGDLVALGDKLGLALEVRNLADAPDLGHGADAVISTLPNGAAAVAGFSAAVRARAVLFDVAYDPWPTPLAAAWLEAGGSVIAGIHMLVEQALIQDRIFIGGDPERPLRAEDDVLAAMWAAVGRPTRR